MEVLVNAKADLEATDEVKHVEDNLVCPVFTQRPRVCSLKDGRTPLLWALFPAKSLGIVEALVNGKADLGVTDPVRCLEDKFVFLCVLQINITP